MPYIAGVWPVPEVAGNKILAGCRYYREKMKIQVKIAWLWCFSDIWIISAFWHNPVLRTSSQKMISFWTSSMRGVLFKLQKVTSISERIDMLQHWLVAGNGLGGSRVEQKIGKNHFPPFSGKSDFTSTWNFFAKKLVYFRKIHHFKVHQRGYNPCGRHLSQLGRNLTENTDYRIFHPLLYMNYPLNFRKLVKFDFFHQIHHFPPKFFCRAFYIPPNHQFSCSIINLFFAGARANARRSSWKALLQNIKILIAK